MKLKAVNEALDHAITGGSEYQWACYPDARYLDYETQNGHASVIFNTNTQEIYEASVEVKEDDARPYRWLNVSSRQSMFDEADARGVDKEIAWDDVKWIDLETEEDFLDKAAAILSGKEFDKRIQVPVELTDEEFLALAKLAHEKDMTINKMIESILVNMIEGIKNEKTTTCCSGGCVDNACCGRAA